LSCHSSEVVLCYLLLAVAEEEPVHRGEPMFDNLCMYVVPTGRVIVPTGRYVVPTGRVIVATGRVIVATGRVIVATGRYVVPAGKCYS
nr:hypothetical protein [Tanacetum cinerariifolium]